MTHAKYGEWASPISIDVVASKTARTGQITTDGNRIFFSEGRPNEKGRMAVTEIGGAHDFIPKEFNVRTRVHEYGGNSFVVDEGTCYFSSFNDNALYEMKEGQAPTLLLKEEGMRYGDPVYSAKHNLLLCVREDHTGDEVLNTLIRVDTENKTAEVIASGHDFYASATIHPDGKQIAYLTWDHPQMPWDGTELHLLTLGGEDKVIAGSDKESIFQPQFAPDGTLYYISDVTGFWNLYSEGKAIYLMEADFGLPLWIFGRSRYAFLLDGTIAAAYTVKAVDYVAIIDPAKRTLNTLDLPFTAIEEVTLFQDHLLFKGAGPLHAPSVVKLDPKTETFEILKASATLPCDKSYISIPQHIEYPTEDGLTANAFYYPPTNPDYTPEEGDLPPLIAKCHGGPTGHVSATLNLEIQYWTSRGYAYLDLNYGGSTGYGRAYRERLKGNWGIIDVNDTVNGALCLVNMGLADPTRMAVQGGSAGGYTTLAALTFQKTFRAGASRYGVSSLEGLATDTHKFESRYLDGLIGPYPEKKVLYDTRSPINNLDQLSTPILFLQGGQDKVVPENQAQSMVDALREKKIPVAYLYYPEEGHGFRAADTIKSAIQGEHYFYSQIFHLHPADSLPPIDILNL